MKFDSSKPVKTKDGAKARIVCVNQKREGYPILALVEDSKGREWPFSYTSKGECEQMFNRDTTDLVNIPVTQGGWLNIYPHKGLGAKLYDTKEQALAGACGDCATVYVEWEE